MSNDIRKTLDESTMSGFQWLAVALCVMLLMLDGFDVLVMAFTASTISKEWSLNGAQLGFLLSAGLFGMAAGSLFLAPLGDKYGRQPIILISLVLVTVGMLLSAYSADQSQLAWLRAITGVGIGGMLASVGVITSEYASNKWRSTCVALQTTGYPIGATIGGVIAAGLLERYGWRSVFIFGGLVSGAMIPVVLMFLPESVDFLLTKQPPNALKKINAQLLKMNQPEIDKLPSVTTGTSQRAKGGLLGLFSAELSLSTMLLWGAFFLLMFSFYFTLSWTPKILTSAGLSNKQGITGGVLLNVGGIVGGLLFGFLASKIQLGRLTMVSLGVTAVAMASFGANTTNLDMAFPIAFAIGMFIFASMAGLYAFAPVIYPASVRTTGMGWAIGIGRLGAILAPLAAGFMIDNKWQPTELYYVFAIPLVLALVAVAVLSITQRDVIRRRGVAATAGH